MIERDLARAKRRHQALEARLPSFSITQAIRGAALFLFCRSLIDCEYLCLSDLCDRIIPPVVRMLR